MTELQPRVTAIFISPDKGIPMQSQERINAIAGIGLEGDRYARGTGAYSKSKREVIRHVSLVSQEAIDAANTANGTTFTAAETRRNILTEGIDLNELVGQEFSVGGVRMKGVGLCDPCARPSALSGKPGFEPAFRQRGGLRAEILTDGDIILGDTIQSNHK
jgi:MOSC domain-containing protein YiiM